MLDELLQNSFYSSEVDLATSHENLAIDSSTTYPDDYYEPNMENELKRESKELSTPKNMDKENQFDSKKWFIFLNSLYEKLSEYEIQKNLTKYNVFNIEHWTQMNRRQGIKINRKNVNLFFDKIGNYNIAEYEYVKNKFLEQRITDIQIQKLNYILSLTLRNDENYKEKCMSSYKLIKGHNISIKKLLKGNYLKNDCANMESDQPSSIAIFALNTIFIDEDITHHEGMITIIAPKWEVIGKRIINLSGFNGDYNKPSVSTDVAIVDSNDKLKTYGKSGNPGLPGGPGGVFFGIGQEFVNGHHLKIIANGGKGDDGEDGHPGMDGLDGDPAVLSKSPQCGAEICKLPSVRCEVFSCKDTESLAALYPGTLNVKTMDCHYKLLGEAGQDGEPGGDGGSGGKGGNSGHIVLFELDKASTISKFNGRGLDGKHGVGGKGGVGGKNGNNLLYNCSTRAFDRPSRNTEIVHQRAESGQNGGIGANTDGMKEPNDISRIYNPSEIISEFKSYLRENLPNYFGSPKLIKFLKRLDEDNNVNSMYSLLGLFDEQRRLEKQFYEINIGEGYIPFYQSLLKRIQNFSNAIKKMDDASEYEQYKKSLNYLYSKIEKRMFDLRENLDIMLISNVENYLSSMKSSIEELKNLKAQKNKADIIEEQRIKYKKNLDEKIKEAKDLIENQISHEIRKINDSIDSDIEALVRRIATRIKLKKEGAKELQDEQDELQKTLKWKALFNVISFATKTISILGPAGAFAGGLLGDFEAATEAVVLSKEKIFDEKLLLLTPKVSAQIRAGKNLISSIMNEKIGTFNTLLDQVDDQIDKDTEQFGFMSNKTRSLRERLSKINPNNFNIAKVQILESELHQELKRMREKSLEIPNENKAKTVREKIEAVENGVQKFHQIGRGVVELANKFKNDPTKLQELTKAIMSNQLAVKKLKIDEDDIHNMIAPTINQIQNDMDKAQLSTKSKVALDVTKWRVQNTLKTVRTKLVEMTKNFQMSEVFSRSLDNMDAALNILIEVYDHIQDYQQQQSVHNYIADISSVQANSVGIRDLVLEKAINQLEICIISNSIVQQYRIGIDAFKQFAFPNAHNYLNQPDLPQDLIMDNNLDNLAYEAIKAIDLMVSNFQKYKNFHTIHENNVGFGEFNSQDETTQPLYVWKNEEFNDTIFDLLSGNKVWLNADITESEVVEEAIKFKELSLDFKARNESKQSEINNLLKAFRIKLVHLGNSYYKFADKYYVVPTKKYSFWYNFKTNADGMPLLRSSEYDKIRNGEYMLSPYALWKINLINLPNKRNITFSDLQKYKDEIDLELAGKVSFLIESLHESDSSNLHMKRYYKTIESYHVGYLNRSEMIKTRKLLVKNINEIYEEPKNVDVRVENTSPNSWFTWKLPNLKILPGADALSVDDMNLLNREVEYNYFKEFESLIEEAEILSDNFPKKEFTRKSYTKNTEVSDSGLSSKFFERAMSYFSDGVEKIKDILSFYTFNGNNNYNGLNIDLPRQQILSDNEINARSPLWPSLKIESAGSESSNAQGYNAKLSLDNSNLILAQLVLGKLFGPNEALSVCSYASPDQERSMKVGELSDEITRYLENSDFGNTESFADNYMRSSRWYQDMYQDEFKTLQKK